MKYLLSLLLLAITLVAHPARGQQTCPEGATCAPKQDMEVFLRLLRDQKCRSQTHPTFSLDPIVIVEDQEGRVYGSGSDPKPYTLTMNWCNYSVTADGKVTLTVAKREPSTWGFRFRPKFSAGFLFADAFTNSDPRAAIDVGMLWEGFFYKTVNLNLATGFRSSGLGVGVDLSKNFGTYIGYAFSYSQLQSNPYVGVSFAFW